MRYGKYLGKTLAEKVEEFTQGRHDDHLQLYDELALMRVTAGDAVKLYDAALSTSKAETIEIATVVLRDALDSVRDMCLAASRIEREAEDKVSARSLQLFVNQIIRAVQRVIEDESVVIELEKEIRDTVRLPEELIGTHSTPDQIVSEMDSTIGG